MGCRSNSVKSGRPKNENRGTNCIKLVPAKKTAFALPDPDSLISECNMDVVIAGIEIAVAQCWQVDTETPAHSRKK